MRRDCRRGARLDRHALPASGCNAGRRLRLPRTAARGVADALRQRADEGAELPRRAGGIPRMLESCSKAPSACWCGSARGEPGQVLLFQLRRAMAPKHCAILVAPDRFIHAEERLGVVEANLSESWRARGLPACSPSPRPERTRWQRLHFHWLAKWWAARSAARSARPSGGRSAPRRQLRDAYCSARSPSRQQCRSRYPTAGVDRRRGGSTALRLEPADRQHHLGHRARGTDG